MSNLTALKEMRARAGKTKIDVAGLTRDMFKDNEKVLNRFFRFNGKDITRFHIPKLTKEEYELEVKFCDKVSEINMKFDTATDYFKKKMAKNSVSVWLDIPLNRLDFSSYPWDDDYFVYDDLILSAMYVDNKFMEEPEEKPTSRDLYIKMDAHQSALPKELYDELYSFCIEAVRQRKAMLYCKVEQCVSVLRMLMEYTNGFSMNTSGNMINTLIGYKKHFEQYFENEDIIQYMSNNTDLDVYCTDRNGCRDYIETYASIIRSLTGLCEEYKSTDSIGFIVELIHNENDKYEPQIIDRVFRREVEFISYIEDLSEED